MKRRIGILTSGGDCPGLNATIRGIVRASCHLYDTEIVGISYGYPGLVAGDLRVMKPEEFSGILPLGGTMLGSKRLTYKTIQEREKNGEKIIKSMVKNYKEAKLDCLVTLGGNGTHKVADWLSKEGLNVIALPKTIDNDIFGTDFTFGFHTAVGIASEALDRIHTTAASHDRCIVVEIMGNKVGWLTLYAGLAGGADAILLPEIPYNLDKVARAVKDRMANGKKFSIIAVAEGAKTQEEAKLKGRELLALRASQSFDCVSHRIAAELSTAAGIEARHTVLGHIQRGGTPCAYDRVLCTQFGAYAAELIRDGVYGVTVALKSNQITYNPLSEVAFKTKNVPMDDVMLKTARNIGISLGD